MMRNSITKESLNDFVADIDVGVGAGLTDVITSVGGTVHLFKTKVDHRPNKLLKSVLLMWFWLWNWC